MLTHICNILYTPLDLSVLTTEGKHRPDSRQHLFRHSSSFGIRSLLFTSERRQQLFKQGEGHDIIENTCRGPVRKGGKKYERECEL